MKRGELTTMRVVQRKKRMFLGMEEDEKRRRYGGIQENEKGWLKTWCERRGSEYMKNGPYS